MNPRLRRTRPLLSFFPLRSPRRTLSIRVTAKSGRGGVWPVQAEPAFHPDAKNYKDGRGEDFLHAAAGFSSFVCLPDMGHCVPGCAGAG